MITKDDFAALLATPLSTTIAKTETFTHTLADFPLAAIQAFLTYGFQRKFNDAVGGAMRGDDPYTPALKVADAKALIADYMAGKVTKRREGGAGVTVETTAGRRVMRAMLSNLLSTADLKAFRALDPADQNTKLDAWVAANVEALADPIAVEVEAMAEAAARKSGLKGLTITL